MADYNPEASHSAEIVAVAWVFTGLGIVTVALMFLGRLEKPKKFGWDDFFILVALACDIIGTSLITYAVSIGYGHHTLWVMKKYGIHNVELGVKYACLCYAFAVTAFSLPNISIAILIVRILSPNKLRKILLYTMVAFQILFSLLNIIIFFVQWQPTRSIWTFSMKGTQWNPSIFEDFTYWVSAYTALTDIVLAIVPVSAFWNLRIPQSTKISLSIMMGLTLISAIFTIVKAVYLHTFADQSDILYNLAPFVVWATVEQDIVLLAACIPNLRPLAPFFRKRAPSLKRIKSWKSSKGSYDEESQNSLA